MSVPLLLFTYPVPMLVKNWNLDIETGQMPDFTAIPLAEQFLLFSTSMLGTVLSWIMSTP